MNRALDGFRLRTKKRSRSRNDGEAETLQLPIQQQKEARLQEKLKDLSNVNNQSRFLRKGCPEEQNFTSPRPEIHDLTEIEHGMNKPAGI